MCVQYLPCKEGRKAHTQHLWEINRSTLVFARNYLHVLCMYYSKMPLEPGENTRFECEKATNDSEASSSQTSVCVSRVLALPHLRFASLCFAWYQPNGIMAPAQWEKAKVFGPSSTALAKYTNCVT